MKEFVRDLARTVLTRFSLKKAADMSELLNDEGREAFVAELFAQYHVSSPTVAHQVIRTVSKSLWG